MISLNVRKSKNLHPNLGTLKRLFHFKATYGSRRCLHVPALKPNFTLCVLFPRPPFFRCWSQSTVSFLYSQVSHLWIQLLSIVICWKMCFFLDENTDSERSLLFQLSILLKWLSVLLWPKRINQKSHRCENTLILSMNHWKLLSSDILLCGKIKFYIGSTVFRFFSHVVKITLHYIVVKMCVYMLILEIY